MKKIAIILAAALGLALGVPAFAQDAPAKVEQPWFMQSKLASSISVTTSSAATKLPTPGFTLWACNTGSNDAYLNFGTANTVTATVAGGTWLKASTCAAYDLFPISVSAPYSYVAIIGSGGSTTVYVEGGAGQPPTALAAGGGGGSTSVTQGTTPWIDSISGWGGGTLGAMANYGTSPGAVLVPGVNAFVTNSPAVTNAGTFAVQNTAATPAGTNNIGTVNGSNVGGYDFQLCIGPTGSTCALTTLNVTASAYAVGNAMGGTQTLTGAARTNGGAGSLNGLRIRSAGGLTPTLWVYAWSKTPSATCTDKSNFVASAADNAYALPGFPIQVALGNAPGTWDTATYAQLTGLLAQFKNQDSSPGTAIYFCIVTATIVTPAATTDLSLDAGGSQD